MKKLFLLLLLLVVSATFAASGDWSDPNSIRRWGYSFFSPPVHTTVTVQVMLTKTEQEARDKCEGAIGCFKFMADQNGKIPSSGGFIIVPMPKDFNDGRGLATLGHEFLHAL